MIGKRLWGVCGLVLCVLLGPWQGLEIRRCAKQTLPPCTLGGSPKRWHGRIAWRTSASVLAHAWAMGADLRMQPSAKTIDLHRYPPRWGMPAETFVERLRDVGWTIKSRQISVTPAFSDDELARTGTLQFDVGIFNARPESQADVCMEACLLYNRLADGALSAGKAPSRFRCEGVTVMAVQSRAQLYIDFVFSPGHSMMGQGTCATPVPNRASCWLLRDVGGAFVDVLRTNIRFDIGFQKCVISSVVKDSGSWVCPEDRGIAQEWAPLMHVTTGVPAVSTPEQAHGFACLCRPGWTGAHCSVSSDVLCDVPSIVPRLDDHCTPPTGIAQVNGTTFIGRTCSASYVDFQCRECSDREKHGDRCTKSKCQQDDGQPWCHERSFSCVGGFCHCPVGWDPSTGCRACQHGFVLDEETDACVAIRSCWSIPDVANPSPSWFEPGQHGGRALLCNGHGQCAPETGRCICEPGWGNGMCTKRFSDCGDPTMVQVDRRNVIGACRTDGHSSAYARVAQDADASIQGSVCSEGGLYGDGNTTFVVTSPYIPEHAWKVCAMLNAVLEPSGGAWDVCSLGAPQFVNTTALSTTLFEGSMSVFDGDVVRCSGDAVGHPRFTEWPSYTGWPVQCRGFQCSPKIAYRAIWGELVPVQGVPTLRKAQSMCVLAASAAVSKKARSSVPSQDADVLRMFRAGLHVPSLDGDAVRFQVLWFHNVDGSGMSFAIERLERHVSGVLLPSEDEFRSYDALLYARIIAPLLAAEADIVSYVACSIDDVFFPGVARVVALEHASMPLWLEPPHI